MWQQVNRHGILKVRDERKGKKMRNQSQEEKREEERREEVLTAAIKACVRLNAGQTSLKVIHSTKEIL